MNKFYMAALPEEWAAGHLGRALLWSKPGSVRDSSKAVARLLTNSRNPDLRSGVLEWLSNLARLDLDHYVFSHTLAPFLSFGRPLYQNLNEAWISKNSHVLGWAVGLRSSAAICPKCVEEDEAVLGYSYWRRIHQLPGHFRCALHPHTNLLSVKRRDACLYTPGHWLNEMHDEELVTHSRVSAIDAGYYEASYAMMHSPVVRSLWIATVELSRSVLFDSPDKTLLRDLASELCNLDPRSNRSRERVDPWSRSTVSSILAQYYSDDLLNDLGFGVRGLSMSRSQAQARGNGPFRTPPVTHSVPLVLGLLLTHWSEDSIWKGWCTWVEPLLAIRLLGIPKCGPQDWRQTPLMHVWPSSSCNVESLKAAAELCDVIVGFTKRSGRWSTLSSQEVSYGMGRLLTSSRIILKAATTLRSNPNGSSEVKLLTVVLRLLALQWLVWQDSISQLDSVYRRRLKDVLGAADRAAARFQVRREPSLSCS